MSGFKRTNNSSGDSASVTLQSDYDDSTMIIEKEKRSDDNDVSASSKLTAKEKEAHINLCANLVQQGKVNFNNAFDLHAIDYLYEFVENEETNFEDANMALLASAKIYSIRVDALYMQCKQFGKNLSTMMAQEQEDIDQAKAAKQVSQKSAPCQSSKTKMAKPSSAGITGEKTSD